MAELVDTPIGYVQESLELFGLKPKNLVVFAVPARLHDICVAQPYCEEHAYVYERWTKPFGINRA